MVAGWKLQRIANKEKPFFIKEYNYAGKKKNKGKNKKQNTKNR
jgi:hypothetical protein